MNAEAVRDDYVDAWKTFTARLAAVSSSIERIVNDGSPGSLHDLVFQLHDIPYREAKAVLAHPAIADSPPNAGAVTGLFFEQIVASVVVPFLRRHCPEAVIARNRCPNPIARSIARDPDLYFQLGDREVIFEIKVAPKKWDLESVRELRAKYAAAGIAYFLIGGYASASLETMRLFESERWACFMSVSPRNRVAADRGARLDEVLHAARIHLKAV
jgi:hypothetical protein